MLLLSHSGIGREILDTLASFPFSLDFGVGDLGDLGIVLLNYTKIYYLNNVLF